MGLETSVERTGKFLTGRPLRKRERRTGDEMRDRTGGIHITYRQLVDRVAGDETRLRELLQSVAVAARGVDETVSEPQWVAQHSYMVPPRKQGAKGTGFPKGILGAPLQPLILSRVEDYIELSMQQRTEAYNVPVSVLFPLPAHELDQYGHQKLQGRVLVKAHPRLYMNDLSGRMYRVEQALAKALKRL